MFCSNCGSQQDDNSKFCQKCGQAMAAATQESQQNQPPVSQPQSKSGKAIKSKKPIYKRVWFWIIVVIVLIGIIGNMGGKESVPESAPAPVESSASEIAPSSQSSQAASESSKAVEAKAKPATISVNMELANGHYTAGIDFPAGKYNITAVSGGGNVISDNMFNGGINAIMGIADDDMYEKEYKNINLPEGTTLSLSSVTVALSCEKASGEPLKPRNQKITETVSLSNGNFVAGEDFPAGVYDIIATGGAGNVTSDNMLKGGINAIMGTASDEMYEKEYKNINLTEGVTLTLSSVQVDLVPSK